MSKKTKQLHKNSLPNANKSIDIEYKDNVGVIFTLRNQFSYQEVERACKELFSSKNFEVIKYWIIDRTNSVKYNLTTLQTRKLAQLCVSASNKNNSLTHILVSGTDLEYGMANMFHVFIDETNWTAISLRDIQAAKQWIMDNG